jgi:RNA polymerase subunit RPABC4/transcription elongation factor Spt4
MVRRTQVCRSCRSFTSTKVCPACKSTNLSTSWKGLVIILNPDSELGRILKIERAGKYALYVG